jgi:hypothetical protein
VNGEGEQHLPSLCGKEEDRPDGRTDTFALDLLKPCELLPGDDSWLPRTLAKGEGDKSGLTCSCMVLARATGVPVRPCDIWDGLKCVFSGRTLIHFTASYVLFSHVHCAHYPRNLP